MSSNKDFLPSSSPISSICAIEIEATLFLFMMNCFKSSFQEYNYRIENRAYEETAPILFTSATRKDTILPPPVRYGCLGTLLIIPRDCTDGRMDGWTYADVRTKIFRINGLPNLLSHGAPRAPLNITELNP